MGDRDVVDLAAEPKVCHEISRAFAPIGFSFRFEEDSVIVRQSGGLRVIVEAALIPQESGYEDVLGAISREIDTITRTADHIQLYIPPRWQGDRRGRARMLTQASVARATIVSPP